MFNRTSSSTTSSASYAEKSVAELLSSLANGNHPGSSANTSTILTPTSLMRGFGSDTAAITPLLTPTSLASIEQMIDIHNEPASSATDLSISRESGFVPPLVNPLVTSSSIMPVKQEFPEMTYGNFRSNATLVKDDPDWEPPSSKRMKVTSTSYMPVMTAAQSLSLPAVTPNATVTSSGTHRPSGPRSRKPHIEMTPEEFEKKTLRRERNKLAAAKCRQRRVDLTNSLLNESENLEEQQVKLEDEIQSLQQQKEQLEFLLQAHKPLCPKKFSSDSAPCSSSQRPNSLPVASAVFTAVSEATGIPISTPSSGVFNFGLEAMLDGHTGLTPVTDGISCASEVNRSTSLDAGSSSGSDALSSPTLMAL